jgi:galactokinase
MRESHASLSHNFEVSTAQMDAVVNELGATPGVFGARMTGGGFGGCVVAMCEPGTSIDGWRVSPVSAACRLD